jgi:anti-anti-sigma factor
VEASNAVSFRVERDVSEELGRAMRADIIRFAQAGRKRFIVDLTGLSILPSIGIGMLASLNATMASQDARFVVMIKNPHILKSLRISRMEEILTIVASPEAAVDALSAEDSR